jgi:hypothetical protein
VWAGGALIAHFQRYDGFPQTVKRAFGRLRDAGVIVIRHGERSFVRTRRTGQDGVPTPANDDLRKMVADLARRLEVVERRLAELRQPRRRGTGISGVAGSMGSEKRTVRPVAPCERPCEVRNHMCEPCGRCAEHEGVTSDGRRDRTEGMRCERTTERSSCRVDR